MGGKKTLNIVLGFLFFGSLWGLFEASFGDWLYTRGIAYASIYLTVLAMFILASSKVFLPYKWTGALVGLIAMLFKLINIPFFACHLLAIFLLGSGFDIAWALVAMLRDRGDTARAREVAEILASYRPADPNVASLLESLADPRSRQ